MRYLVTMELIGTPPVSPQEMVRHIEQIIIPMHEKLEAEKKILAGGLVAGARTITVIVDVESHSFLESNEYFRFSSSTQLSLNSNSLDALGNSNITTPSLADRSLMEEDQHEEENNQSTTCSVECPDASGPPAGRCRASPPYSRPPTQGPASQRTKSKREKKGGHK
jgi:hypothetical protein